MIVEFDKSFDKSIRKISNPIIFKRVERIILEFDKAATLLEIHHIKKLTGFRNYYRIRIGDYRLGVELINKSTVRLIILAHRKDIYKVFP
jgi:mRNA interferase RelE/StbE